MGVVPALELMLPWFTHSVSPDVVLHDTFCTSHTGKAVSSRILEASVCRIGKCRKAVSPVGSVVVTLRCLATVWRIALRRVWRVAGGPTEAGAVPARALVAVPSLPAHHAVTGWPAALHAADAVFASIRHDPVLSRQRPQCGPSLLRIARRPICPTHSLRR